MEECHVIPHRTRLTAYNKEPIGEENFYIIRKSQIKNMIFSNNV